MDIVIGYDINEYYAQISYAAQGQEPKTLEFPSQKEEGNIETALCKRIGVNQWFCGKEAVRKGVSGGGTLVEHLWQLLEQQDTIVIEKQEYGVAELCNLFLARTLDWALGRLEQIYEEAVNVRALVLTSDLWSDRMRECSQVLGRGLPVDSDRIFYQGHQDSLFSYLVHQPERLRGYETGVFDLTGEQMITYRIEMNHKTRPVVVTVDREEADGLVRKKHYASIMEHDRELEQLDRKLKAYVEEFTRGRIVTNLYLIGEGFGGEWYKESLKVLCRNRKVYAGNNLFGKGACYSALERVWHEELTEQFLFLGKDMLRYNIGISMDADGQEEYVPLLDAGTNWYDSNANVTFMMEQAEDIELLITPIDGTGMYKETLHLPPMQERAFRAYRLSLEARMQSTEQLFVCIKDEGFGEIFEKTPVDMTYDLKLGEKGMP